MRKKKKKNNQILNLKKMDSKFQDQMVVLMAATVGLVIPVPQKIKEEHKVKVTSEQDLEDIMISVGKNNSSEKVRLLISVIIEQCSVTDIMQLSNKLRDLIGSCLEYLWDHPNERKNLTHEELRAFMNNLGIEAEE